MSVLTDVDGRVSTTRNDTPETGDSFSVVIPRCSSVNLKPSASDHTLIKANRKLQPLSVVG